MNKGDIFTIYLDGEIMTLCVLGFYNEEYSGERMVVLALVNQDNLLYISRENLESIFSPKDYLN